MYSLVLNTRDASRQRSKCVLTAQLYSERHARACYRSCALWIRSLALSLCGDSSRRDACAKTTPKSARQTRTAFFFFFWIAFSTLSLSTSAWCKVTDESSSTEGDQCMGFIMTGRPGGDAGVPYGAVYPTLEEAEHDAINRCSKTNLAEEEGSAEVCKTWCIHP
jgi:hypothetical protein